MPDCSCCNGAGVKSLTDKAVTSKRAAFVWWLGWSRLQTKGERHTNLARELLVYRSSYVIAGESLAVLYGLFSAELMPPISPFSVSLTLLEYVLCELRVFTVRESGFLSRSRCLKRHALFVPVELLKFPALHVHPSLGMTDIPV